MKKAIDSEFVKKCLDSRNDTGVTPSVRPKGHQSKKVESFPHAPCVD